MPHVNINLEPLSVLTYDQKCILRSLYERYSNDPIFKDNPILHKNTPISMLFEGERVTVSLSHSLIMHGLASGPEHAHFIIDDEDTILGYGSDGCVKTAKRYILPIGEQSIEVKEHDQIVKIFTITRTLYQNDEEWEEMINHTREMVYLEHEINFKLHQNVKDVVTLSKNNGLNNSVEFYLYTPNLGQTLSNYLKSNSLSNDDLLQLLSNIYKKIDTLHKMGYVHCDLKPDNILVDNNGIPHIIDFSASKRISESGTDHPKGTSKYLDPFTFDHTGPTSAKADMYSMALVSSVVLGSDYDKTTEFQIFSIWAKPEKINDLAFKKINKIADKQKKQILINFLKLMAHPETQNRPTAECCQHFFRYMKNEINPRTVINECIATGNMNFSDPEKIKMIFLAKSIYALSETDPRRIALLCSLSDDGKNHLKEIFTPCPKQTNMDTLFLVASVTIDEMIKESSILNQLVSTLFTSSDAKLKMYRTIFSNPKLENGIKCLILLSLIHSKSSNQLKNAILIHSNVTPSQLAAKLQQDIHKQYGINNFQSKNFKQLMTNIDRHICKGSDPLEISNPSLTECLAIIEKIKTNPYEAKLDSLGSHFTSLANRLLS